MNFSRFFAELKRRNVYRVAIAYAVVGWLVMQVAATVVPALHLPGAITTAVVVLVLLGFPIALVLAWAFELTPEGIQLTPEAAGEVRRKPPMRRGVFWSLVALGAVAGMALSVYFVRQRSASPGATATLPAGKRAVAVLPFENLSEDKANAYFADGMQDEIITRLAKVGDLKVISRTSTLPYRTRPEKLTEIARQLGVGHVVEGSVQKIGDRVRINVQLIEAATDDHLWAELYDRNVADVFAMQTEVATKIASSLQAKLSGREQKAMAAKPTENMAAYDMYLRGIDYYSLPGQTPTHERLAADAFAEAVRIDPDFAQAWAMLARVSSSLYFLHIDRTPARQEIARSAAETATRLSPNAPETLLANAYFRYHVQRDDEGARELFEHFRREVPNSSEALEALARIARRQNRWRDCVRLFEEASKLNPRDAHVFMDRSWTFSMVRDHAATLEMLEQAEAIAPADVDVLENKASLFMAVGDLVAARAAVEKIPATKQTDVRVILLFYERRYDEAARLLEQKLSRAERPVIPADGATSHEWLGLIRARAGDAAGAKQAYLTAREELQKLAREQPENIHIAGALARAEAGLGNKEAALREAERGVAVLPFSEDPVFAPITEENLAGVEAQVGEHDRAITRLERLLRTPYGAYPVTIARLRLDPLWDPLREHPRFKAIVEGPEPKTIHN